MVLTVFSLACLLAAALLGAEQAVRWPQYRANPFVIKTGQPAAHDRQGSLAVADLDGDGLLDFLYTTPGMIGAYHHDGNQLWLLRVPIRLTGQAESEGLPGLHHPGVQAADVDGDGETEVLFLQQDGSVVIVSGKTGRTKRTARPRTFGEVTAWETAIICNLRGKGDRDLLLQATNPKGYRMGRYLAAFQLDRLEGEPLWTTDRYLGCAHGPAKVADLDGDGRDEIVGSTVFLPDGTLAEQCAYPPFRVHLDSIFIYDLRPDLPGLEAVLLEEGDNQVAMMNLSQGLVWRTHHRGQEPQNAAVGDFDPKRPGLEIWCRSRHDINQTPWVFDAQGKLIAEWEMSKTAPQGWTNAGVEEIWAIDWDGSGPRLCAAKERHKDGDVAVFEPLTGRFVKRWKEQAARLFVADVSGDSREELLVVNGSEIRIYWNDQHNPHPQRPRYWTQPHYRRNKANWNYYSP